jgi:hypothetical protein
MNRSQGRAPALSVSPAQGGLIAFPAIWARWRNRDGGEIDTVAITVAPLHAGGGGAGALRGLARLQENRGGSGARPVATLLDYLFEAIEMHPKLNDSRRDEPTIQQPLQMQLLL